MGENEVNNYKAYEAYLSIVGSTPSEYYKDYYKEFVESNFDDSTSIKRVYHNGRSIDVRVVGIYTKESPIRKIEGFKKIIFNGLGYEVKIGDIFEFDENHWLCLDTKTSSVNESCSVLKCNNAISLFVNNRIHQIPVAIEDAIRFHDLDIEDTKYFSIPDSKIIMLVPDNQLTNGNVRRGDVYNLSNDSYRVIDRNSVIKPGLIVLKLEYTSEEQILPSVNNEQPVQAEYKIIGDSEIKIGQTKTYQALKFDSQNVIIEGVEFEFEIESGGTPSSAYELIVLSGNECQIKCMNSTYNIILRATDEDNEEVVEKTIMLKGLF